MVGLMLALQAAAGFVGAQPIAPRKWLRDDDYPEAALRDGLEGAQRVALTIDPTGRPVACAVTMSSGADRLKDTPCRILMRRARFTPAHDADGSAIMGVATYGGSYALPLPGRVRPQIAYDLALPVNRLPAGTASPIVAIETLVDADGKAEGCRVAKGSGSDALDKLACRAATDSPVARIAAADGHRMRAVVAQSVLFMVPEKR